MYVDDSAVRSSSPPDRVRRIIKSPPPHVASRTSHNCTIKRVMERYVSPVSSRVDATSNPSMRSSSTSSTVDVLPLESAQLNTPLWFRKYEEESRFHRVSRRISEPVATPLRASKIVAEKEPTAAYAEREVPRMGVLRRKERTAIDPKALQPKLYNEIAILPDHSSKIYEEPQWLEVPTERPKRGNRRRMAPEDGQLAVAPVRRMSALTSYSPAHRDPVPEVYEEQQDSLLSEEGVNSEDASEDMEAQQPITRIRVQSRRAPSIESDDAGKLGARYVDGEQNGRGPVVPEVPSTTIEEHMSFLKVRDTKRHEKQYRKAMKEQDGKIAPRPTTLIRTRHGALKAIPYMGGSNGGPKAILSKEMQYDKSATETPISSKVSENSALPSASSPVETKETARMGDDRGSVPFSNELSAGRRRRGGYLFEID